MSLRGELFTGILCRRPDERGDLALGLRRLRLCACLLPRAEGFLATPCLWPFSSTPLAAASPVGEAREEQGTMATRVAKHDVRTFFFSSSVLIILVSG